jgi:negative regulator of replication initiation
MPYKHTIKVSEEVYRRLLELTRKHNLESPNQLLERLLSHGVTPSESDRVTPSVQQAHQSKGVTPSQTHGVTPSVEVRRRDYFWWTIKAGEGRNAIETDLNNIQLKKLCQVGLLVKDVCEKVDLSRL